MLVGLPTVRKISMLLLRREYRSLGAIVDRLTELFGGRDHFRAGEQSWHLPNGSVIEPSAWPCSS